MQYRVGTKCLQTHTVVISPGPKSVTVIDTCILGVTPILSSRPVG